MASKRYALVDADGLVTNVVEWDGEAEWSAPENMTAIEADEAVAIGWTRQSDAWVGPTEAEDPQWT